ncbi:MAG: zinc-binding dehydrogenase [Candidatus Hinthialibacter antarcticus]|nr:zinc-binding dehydrogenase [Candidatus Hinthialibacter antarcticus]
MKTRAAVLYELNQPLRIEEIEIPALKPGQLLVDVAYSGVCHSQLMEAQGKRGTDRYLPHLLGHEGAGVVVEIGEGVTKVQPGDRVVLTWIKGSGIDSGGSIYRNGEQAINAGAITTFSDSTVVSENRCVKIEDDIPLDIAALFGCAVLTGAGIVLNSVRPKPNSRMVVWGVGGIGLSAVMAAKLSGVSLLIAVDAQASKLELAKAFGATHTINALEEDAPARIREIVGADGVDYAVEAAGQTSTIESAFNSVRKNGGLCVFASHPPSGEKICLEPHDLISGKQIRGSWGGESNSDEDIPRFAEFYRQGCLPLEKLITNRYPLDEVNKALADLERGDVGRPMLELEGECD